MEDEIVEPTPEELEKISFLALLIGDIEGGPYYPMFTQDQYLTFLKAAKGDVSKASVLVAISASFMVSSESSREQIGELSISSSAASNYLKLLDYLVKNAGKSPPPGLMPWFGGQDRPDRNKLLDFKLCDSGIFPWTTCLDTYIPRFVRCCGDNC